MPLRTWTTYLRKIWYLNDQQSGGANEVAKVEIITKQSGIGKVNLKDIDDCVHQTTSVSMPFLQHLEVWNPGSPLVSSRYWSSIWIQALLEEPSIPGTFGVRNHPEIGCIF